MPSRLPWHKLKDAAADAAYAVADPVSAYRYGMSSSDKYRKAFSGEIPGSEAIKSEADIDKENRRAAGYLFGKNQPGLARPLTAVANKLRGTLSDEDPALQEIASSSTEQGIADAAMEPPPGWRQAVEAVALHGPGLGGLLAGYNQFAAPRQPLGPSMAVQERTRRR